MICTPVSSATSRTAQVRTDSQGSTLPLGMGPVVVAGAVDQEHLEVLTVLAPHEGTGGPLGPVAEPFFLLDGLMARPSQCRPLTRERARAMRLSWMSSRRLPCASTR